MFLKNDVVTGFWERDGVTSNRMFWSVGWPVRYARKRDSSVESESVFESASESELSSESRLRLGLKSRSEINEPVIERLISLEFELLSSLANVVIFLARTLINSRVYKLFKVFTKCGISPKSIHKGEESR